MNILTNIQSPSTDVDFDGFTAALNLIRHVPAEPHASGTKVVPPVNFAMVEAGVYRAGKPSKHSYPFMQSLNLKTIMYLSSSKDSEANKKFAQENDIKYFHFLIKENKEPFQQIDQEELAKALVECIVKDVRNHPMLIYSDRGKHRIGCIVGCLRKLQKWSLASIFDEYQRFSGSKIYIADQEFIEIFSAPVNFDIHYVPKWLLKCM
ncbi:tyrosine phosphatase family-domain-containing protein [Obelidium mucronatum]|nr:tyrosine phosphatase family-domain-containing protein [Obelidium mucronatum]